jgi:hypothetical protein
LFRIAIGRAAGISVEDAVSEDLHRPLNLLERSYIAEAAEQLESLIQGEAREYGDDWWN